MFRYSETRGDDQEIFFAEHAVNLHLPLLSPLRDVRVKFIAAHESGPFAFEKRIFGFCPADRRSIYILTGLNTREIVLTSLHETRHAWQDAVGYRGSRERDARIFELEAGVPHTEIAILYWFRRLDTRVWRSDVEPKSRAITGGKGSAQISGRNLMFETIDERIAQIKSLIARLPATSRFDNQREALKRELAERIAQAA